MQSILVIDDDQQARRIVRAALERAGYSVLEAADGLDGTRLVEAHGPSLVITDILMPNKEGLEVIRELRARDGALPIIAISGGSDHVAPDSVLQLATWFGAKAILFKPFTPGELLSVVQSTLASAA